MFSLNSNKLIFFQLTSNNIIHSTFATFIFMVLVLNKELILATNLALVSSFTILTSKIFSLNLRSIFIAKFNNERFNNFILLRLIISILLYLLSFFFAYLFLDIKNEIIYLLIVVFVFQWMIELNLVKIEIENNFKKISRLFFINLIVILLIIISSFLFDFEYFERNFISLRVIFILFLHKYC